MNLKGNSSYRQINPSPKLIDFVDSYWESKNITEKPLKRIIFPDSFFKLVITVVEGKIVALFLTGLWTNQVEIEIPAKSTIFGIKFKLLAPEYVFNHEVATLLLNKQMLEHNFWNINTFKFENLEKFVRQIEPIILEKASKISVDERKIKLSLLICYSKGKIKIKDLAEQIGWSNRQITRYLNKYIGVSLKEYLNICKVYNSYSQIRIGNFFPGEEYYDQSHLIKEIKKHTGNTPKQLHKEQDDRFVQLKNIKI